MSDPHASAGRDRRDLRLTDDLLERELELDLLAGALAAAKDGNGRVVVVEGSAGLGKSALLDFAAARASATGFAVAQARGLEMLSPVPWSIALSLTGPALAGHSSSARRKLLSGPGAPARELLGSTRARAARAGRPPDEAALASSFVWVISALAESGPMALLVDDAQWADSPSLRFLAGIGNRAADLPLCLVVARRRSEPGETGRELLDGLAVQPGSVLIEPAPLSVEASSVLIRRALGEHASDELAGACVQATGGNPFYLNQLVIELASEGTGAGRADAARVRTLTPAAVTRAVLVRLARMGPGALALAEAVSVLGEECAFMCAAQLAGLERPDAVDAADALALAEILRGAEPLEFAHPLVAASIYAEIPPARRGEMHLQAARLLAHAGEDPQVVAAQLMAVGGRAEAWVVEALRSAARTALRRSAAGAAADYLERALREPPAAEERAEVHEELARAEAAAGRAQAIERFEQLLELPELLEDRVQRAPVHLALGRTLAAQGRNADALAAFERGLAEQGETLEDSGRELRAAYWAAKTMSAQASPAELEQLGRLITSVELEDPTPGERALLAAVAMGQAFRCNPRAQVVELALRAWGDGALLAAETSDGLYWTLVTGALMFADELELELAICEQALADARRRGSRLGFATSSFIRGGVLAQQGRNDDAIVEFELALAAREDGWSQYLGTAVGGLCAALVERGDLDGARRALQIAEEQPGLTESVEYTVVLTRRGELLLAEGRPSEALDQLEAAGKTLSAMFDYVSWAPWRAGAVRALLALERHKRARELAEEMVGLTRRLGAPSALALALRTLARTESGTRAIELLEEAVSLFEGRSERLQHAYALVEHGAALRRAGRRGASADPLGHGLALAERGGLRALAEQARVELAAAGARTLRHTLSGVESLTPTERRVASLAAGDLSNREIAQQLFVTIKTVEYHLGNTYRKLEIRSRTGLAGALGSTDPGLAVAHDASQGS
jgi:DNA-binding CsgD family transcriptional regulator